MTRTIEHWFNTIEDETMRKKALANYKNNPLHGETTFYNSLASALMAAFSWQKSPEGSMYWDRCFFLFKYFKSAKPQKTIEQWLKQIKDKKLRNEALEFHQLDGRTNKTILYSCFSDALMNAFNWTKTEQGLFWKAMYEGACAAENLKPVKK
jgi:hypothetical protein